MTTKQELEALAEGLERTSRISWQWASEDRPSPWAKGDCLRMAQRCSSAAVELRARAQEMNDEAD